MVAKAKRAPAVKAGVADVTPLSMSIANAAKAAGLSRSFIYQQIKEGTGPRTFKCGARRLVTPADLAEWIEILRDGGRRVAA
jgi:excisionase family DNA binding protein